MIDASWLVFVIASLVLIATPGQDMILVMSRSVAQGVSAGVVTAAGVSVGLVGHTVLATLGLGAILRTSEWLFIALKLVGAAYLVYLGVGLLRTKQESLPIGTQPVRGLRRLFVDGAVSNLSDSEGFESLMQNYKVSLAHRAIVECNGNKTLAARKLQVSRAYLHRLIRQAPNEVHAMPYQNVTEFRKTASGS